MTFSHYNAVQDYLKYLFYLRYEKDCLCLKDCLCTCTWNVNKEKCLMQIFKEFFSCKLTPLSLFSFVSTLL